MGVTGISSVGLSSGLRANCCGGGKRKEVSFSGEKSAPTKDDQYLRFASKVIAVQQRVITDLVRENAILQANRKLDRMA